LQQQATWIVHGDAQARAALMRMARVPALAGPPSLGAFPPAPSPGAVVLHVPLAAQDALAFAHNAAWQHPHAHWLLLVDPGLDAGWVAAAFAPLRHAVLLFPPERAALEQALRRALAGATPSLAALRQRDVLVARFARTLGDVALPDLAAEAAGHLAVTGERGTGKLLLARTLHALAGAAGEERVAFVLLAGAPGASAAALEAQLAAAAERADRLSVCLEAPERLAPAVQREVASWVELGAPGVLLDPTRILWIFLRSEAFGASAPLEPTLAELCETPALRLPPLRERPGAALRFAEQWLREHFAAQGREPRALDASARDAIARDPWPGNTRELEAALRRAVGAAREGDEAPIEAAALGLATAPEVPERESASGAREAPLASARLPISRGPASPTGSAPPAPSGPPAGRALAAEEAPRPEPALLTELELEPAHAEGSPRITHAAPELAAGVPDAEAAALAGAGPNDSVARADERAPTASAAEPSRAAAAAPGEQAASAPAAASPRSPAAALPQLRALAAAAARELAPALEALRASGADPASGAPLARRLARLEEFARLDLTVRGSCEAAPLLALLLEERRAAIDAKRLLVLRELEEESTRVHAPEAALRFALGAVLDALLEAAPPRADLYVSARCEPGGGVRRVRVKLRFHGALALAADELQLLLTRAVLAALGAELTTRTHGAEHEVWIELPG
jgi:hypothetical protein